MASNDPQDNEGMEGNSYVRDSMGLSSIAESLGVGPLSLEEQNETAQTRNHVEEEMKYSNNPIVSSNKVTNNNDDTNNSSYVTSPLGMAPLDSSYTLSPLKSFDQEEEDISKPRGNSLLFVNSFNPNDRTTSNNKYFNTTTELDLERQQNDNDDDEAGMFENENMDSFDQEYSGGNKGQPKKRSSILFDASPSQLNEYNQHSHSAMSPRTVSRKMQQVRNTLKGCDASELLMFATEAIEAIAVNENVDHNEQNISIEEFATKSPEEYEIIEEDVDKLALLDLAYSHLAQRVQKRLNPATLDHLTHRLEIHESMREQDFNDSIRYTSPEKVTVRIVQIVWHFRFYCYLFCLNYVW
jgi:hypothetical protein